MKKRLNPDTPDFRIYRIALLSFLLFFGCGGDMDENLPCPFCTAPCGNSEYNPTTHFCSDGKTYSCNNLPYDPKTNFCHDDKTYTCNNKPYNPSTEFCSDVKVYSKCGGTATFDPATESCCGSNDKPYNPTTEFCSGTTIYTKCGGGAYNPSEQFCQGTMAYTKCGGSDYNPSKQFCSNGTLKNYSGSISMSSYGNYKTMLIGEQIWLAENLNYNVEGSVCYDNQESNCSIYGRLYDWAMAMALPSICNSTSCSSQISAKHQGICPDGWHIPSKDEWKTLIDFVGGRDVAYTKLMATSGWSGGNGTDEYGFSALPGGYFYPGGYFVSGGYRGSAYWWSASEGTDSSAYTLYLSGEFNRGKGGLYSVRCLEDSYKCGTRYYDPSAEFCSGNNIYSKCGGTATFDPATEKCCGSNNKPYNLSTEFCSGNMAYTKCSGSAYNTSKQFCSNGTLKNYSGSITYEGQTYKTIEIGEEIWFAENLNYNAEGSVCNNNQDINCSIYGRLYDWATAMALPSSCNSTSCSSQIDSPHRGICPVGWHISYGTPISEATKLKSASGWPRYSDWDSGTDDYGFSALPGGWYSNGRFEYVGNYGYWWSGSESKSEASYIAIGSYSENVSYGYGDKSRLLSVRCMQDRCGGRDYNSATQFCYNKTIYDKCGGSKYNTYNQRCSGNVIETSCSSEWYDASNSNLRCQNNVVETRCGSEWYNASNFNLRCQNNVIEAKCGTNNWYNSSTQYCSDGTVGNYGTVTDNGGKAYKTVEIGTQVWMAENLNYDTEGSVCYNNQDINCSIYGRLYDWATAMALPSSCNSTSCSDQIDTKHKGICPDGWHIHSNAEWTVLTDYVGGSSTAGTKLKATSGWYNNGNGTDDYGFSALPGGYGHSNGGFYSNGGYWWSATENGAYYRYMGYGNESVSRINYGKDLLFSVRCLRD